METYLSKLLITNTYLNTNNNGKILLFLYTKFIFKIKQNDNTNNIRSHSNTNLLRYTQIHIRTHKRICTRKFMGTMSNHIRFIIHISSRHYHDNIQNCPTHPNHNHGRKTLLKPFLCIT